MSHHWPVEYVRLGGSTQPPQQDEAPGQGPRPLAGECDRQILDASESERDSGLDVRREFGEVHRRDGKWWLTAPDAAGPTSVAGQLLGPSPLQVEPGTPIQTGEVVWTFAPANWIVVAHQQVVVSAPCCLAVNYALHHCGMPVVGPVLARNFGRQRSAQLRLSLELEDYGDRCQLDIPPLDPGARVSLAAPAVGSRLSSLRRRLQPNRVDLLVEFGGTRLLKELVALGFWDWSHDESALKTIAAFVSPRNPVVERIILDSQRDLRQAAGIGSFEELLKSGSDEAEQLVLKAVYDNLARRRNIQYLDPQLVETSSRTGTYQTIKPPQRIFAPDPSGPDGQATCLDLAVLMAACLEKAALCPLVVLAGNDEGLPTHAFLGCWLGSTPGSRAVIRDAALLRHQVARGNIIVVECTGVARGVLGRGETLPFDAALTRGNRQIDSYAWLAAVDVRAARPPLGSITPMESPLEPEAVAAYDEAEQFARRKRRTAIEITYLLYAVLAVEGEITKWLFQRAGLGLEQIREKLDALISTRQATEEAVPTWNYSECQRLAETYAWQSGLSSVREQDVLWAILNKRRDSRQLLAACARIGIDPDHLAHLMNERYPDPRLPFKTSGSLRSSLD